MASVRMSEALRSSITSKAKGLFEPALDKARTSLPNDWYDRLAEEVCEKNINSLPIMQKVPIEQWPDDWTKRVNRIYVLIRNDDKSYQIYSPELVKPIKVPTCVKTDGINPSLRLNISEPFTCSDKLFNEFYQVKLKEEKIVIEQKEFVENIKNITSRCNTLKQFLNVWPQGENLVPANVMSKFNTPVKKRSNPAEHILPEINKNLSAVLIKRTLINRNK